MATSNIFNSTVVKVPVVETKTVDGRRGIGL